MRTREGKEKRGRWLYRDYISKFLFPVYVPVRFTALQVRPTRSPQVVCLGKPLPSFLLLLRLFPPFYLLLFTLSFPRSPLDVGVPLGQARAFSCRMKLSLYIFISISLEVSLEKLFFRGFGVLCSLLRFPYYSWHEPFHPVRRLLFVWLVA